MSSGSDKAKLLKTFPKTLISMTQSSFYPFVRLELKMHSISVIPKMVKKVITNLIDSSKASGPDCISVVVLKNCEPEILYILAELFNKCLKESYFADCWKVSSVVPVFKNVAGSTAKSYRPVRLLSVVSQAFEKLVNGIVDHLNKCGLFSDFSMVLALLDQLRINCRSSTAVVSDRIVGAFKRARTPRTVALDTSKVFVSAWHARLWNFRSDIWPYFFFFQ